MFRERNAYLDHYWKYYSNQKLVVAPYSVTGKIYHVWACEHFLLSSLFCPFTGTMSLSSFWCIVVVVYILSTDHNYIVTSQISTLGTKYKQGLFLSNNNKMNSLAHTKTFTIRTSSEIVWKSSDYWLQSEGSYSHFIIPVITATFTSTDTIWGQNCRKYYCKAII